MRIIINTTPLLIANDNFSDYVTASMDPDIQVSDDDEQDIVEE